MNKKEAAVIVIVGSCVSHAIYDYVKERIKENINRKKALADARRWLEAWSNYSRATSFKKEEGELDEKV